MQLDSHRCDEVVVSGLHHGRRVDDRGARVMTGGVVEGRRKLTVQDVTTGWVS